MSRTKHSPSSVIYQREQLMEMQDLVRRRLNGEVVPLDLISLRRLLSEDAVCEEDEKGGRYKGAEKGKVVRIAKGNSTIMVDSKCRDKLPDSDSSCDDASRKPEMPHAKKSGRESIGTSEHKALANHNHQLNPTSPSTLFNASAEDSDSSLSDISSISDHCPAPKIPRLKAPPKPPSKPEQNQTSTSRYQTRAKHPSNITTLFSSPQNRPASSNRTSLHHTLQTLPFDTEPTDRPSWITGLRKPLPHSSLSSVQNLEIRIRIYDDEIARLVAIREKLSYCIPEGGEGGEWRYEHWGGTFDVQLGKSKKQVFARGMWRFVGEAGLLGCLLDEWPRDVWGEPLGWAVRTGDGEESGGGEQEGGGYSSDEGSGDGVENEEECGNEADDEDERGDGDVDVDMDGDDRGE